MAETGSGIRVRLRRMGGSYPGSRESGMGGLTENDDSCRLERLDGGVGWSPLRVILYIYIYNMRVCAETWDSVGGERDGQLAEIEKEKKKERKGSSERSHRPALYWFVGVVVGWSISCKMQCNASK